YGVYAAHVQEIAIENGDPTAGIGAGVYSLFNDLAIANPPAGPYVTPRDYFRTGLGKFEWESDETRKRKREIDQASLHVNWNITEGLTITSVTSWVKGDFANPEDSDGSPLRAIEAKYFGDGDQWSQELRLTSDFDGPFDFVGGIYYAREDLDIATDLFLMTDVDFNLDGLIDSDDCLDPFLAFGDYDPGPPENDPLPAPSPSADGQNADLILDSLGAGLRLRSFVALGCGYRNDFQQERRSIAGFFDGSYAIFENTSLLFGLRVTNDRTEVDNFRTAVEGAGVFLFDTVPSTDDEIDDTELTWKAGVEQRFSEDVLGYLTYSRGYRSGAFNGQAFFDPSEFNAVDPETLDAIELGAKSTLADGRVQLNAALFFYIYKDQQLIDVDPATAAQTLVNIDRTEVLGFEIETIAQITDRWRISGGVGFLDGEAKKGIVSGINVKGDTLPNAPDFSASIASDLDLWTGDFGTFAWHIDANYVGAQYYTLPHVRRTLVDNYALFDTRFTFESSSESWEAGFWIRNIGNDFYRTDIISLAGFGLDYTHVGPPRTYGGDVTFHF
ncbi:MAG TPA: TonB-dependent receptor, partial [Myxococcota bacterium]|nr:TonB-dependent receptor [Myxococcota bacterium]